MDFGELCIRLTHPAIEYNNFKKSKTIVELENMMFCDTSNN